MNKVFDFLKHAVVKRDLEVELKNIHSTGEAMQTWNGIVAMNHPVDGLPRFSVLSDKLIRAMAVCDYKAEITLADKLLTVKKDRLRVTIPYITEFEPIKGIKGDKIPVPADFIEKIQKVFPFVSEDASRNWATSINIDDGMAYATNNIIIVRTPLDLPDMLLPIDLVLILLKVKVNPVTMVINKNMIRFNYKKKVWIQGLKKSESWPDFKEFFDQMKKAKPVPKDFAKILDDLTPFCPDDLIEIKGGVLSSGEAVYEGVDLPDSSFSCLHMKKVLAYADRLNMKDVRYTIKGDNIEGIMASRV